MPNHTLGSTHSFENLLHGYAADQPQGDGPHHLIFKGDEILALCLRYKFNPEPGEVWIGGDEDTAKWGKKLAALKDQKTLPVYYSPKNRTFYEYRGHYFITGDTEDPQELAKRKGSTPLSRIVFIKLIKAPAR
jgi:hypothetical protein